LNFNGLCSTQREIKVGARGLAENSPALRCHTHIISEKVAMKIYEGSIGQTLLENVMGKGDFNVEQQTKTGDIIVDLFG
jgi:hypothetical protein